MALPIRFVDQLKTGKNANNNCVPACLEAGAAALGVNVSTQQLHDAAYGSAHTGPTAPWIYTDEASDVLRQRGTSLDRVYGDESALVARMHSEVRAGRPVLLAIPSAWNDFSIPVSVRRIQQYPNGTWMPTHFVLIYDEYAGGLGAMNPWGGFRHTNSDGNWAKLLTLGSIWVMRKEGTVSNSSMLDINQVSNFFTQVDGNHWRCKQTGKTIQMGILDGYRKLWPTGTVPFAGLPLTDEFGVTVNGRGFWAQVFERAIMVYDPSHALDTAPGFGEFYPAKWDDPRVNPLFKAVADARDAAVRDRDAARAQLDPITKERDAARKEAAEAKAALEELTKKGTASQEELDAAKRQVAEAVTRAEAAETRAAEAESLAARMAQQLDAQDSARKAVAAMAAALRAQEGMQ